MVSARVATRYFLAYLWLTSSSTFQADSESREVRVHSCLLSPNILGACRTVNNYLIAEYKYIKTRRPSSQAWVVRSLLSVRAEQGFRRQQQRTPYFPRFGGTTGALLLPAGL